MTSNKKFYLSTISIFTISSLLFLYAFRGSLQFRIELLSNFSNLTLKLIIKTVLYFIIFIFVAFLIYKIFRIYISRKRNYKFLLAGWIMYFFSFSLLVLTDWALIRFPLDQIATVYYTLSNIQGGGVDNSIFFEAFSILIYCLIFSVACFFSIFICGRNFNKEISFSSDSNNLVCISNNNARIKIKINIDLIYLVIGIFSIIFSIIQVYKDLHVSEYLRFIEKRNEKPFDSDFYRSEYISPEYENILFPDKKKNIIIILMESMESSFADTKSDGLLQKNLIPNLTKLAEQNINFSETLKTGGGIDLSGTGWTVASMTAKFAGLPFNMTDNQGNTGRFFFLPGAVTLTDILAYNGYNQRFIFGSDKRFAGRDALLETHGNVEIHDKAWYKKNGMLPEDYNVFWGFEDEKLYDYAKIELTKMSELNQPFMFGLLTIDTHNPTGYLCNICPNSEDMPIKNAILCADNQIGNFINWCKKQNWYDETIIVIMGDHLFMDTEATTPFSGNDQKAFRRWINVFINADKTNMVNAVIKNRFFSSVDMFPTILAAAGCKIKGDRLGFGVNLFSQEKTLRERFSMDYINSEIMANSIQYRNMEFPKDFPK